MLEKMGYRSHGGTGGLKFVERYPLEDSNRSLWDGEDSLEYGYRNPLIDFGGTLHDSKALLSAELEDVGLFDTSSPVADAAGDIFDGALSVGKDVIDGITSISEDGYDGETGIALVGVGAGAASIWAGLLPEVLPTLAAAGPAGLAAAALLSIIGLSVVGTGLLTIKEGAEVILGGDD